MKRLSRKDLKEKIKTLERRNIVLESEAEGARKEAKELEDRLVWLGSRLDIKQAEVPCVEVKPQAWGQYFSFIPGTKISDEMMDEIKKKLVTSIVSGLIQKNYVQFIIHEEEDFGWPTIAAKLYVVPWEKTVIGRKDGVKMFFEKRNTESGGGADER